MSREKASGAHRSELGGIRRPDFLQNRNDQMAASESFQRLRSQDHRHRPSEAAPVPTLARGIVASNTLRPEAQAGHRARDEVIGRRREVVTNPPAMSRGDRNRLSADDGNGYGASVTRGIAFRHLIQGPALMLTTLALLVSAVVPQGFMPSGSRGAPLVVCTGHGPMQMAKASGDGPAHSSPVHGNAGICAFADHGLTTPAPIMLVLMAVPLRSARIANQAVTGLTPGLGLAAPPPPSQAPPALLL